jgi:hypothetical protein
LKIDDTEVPEADIGCWKDLLDKSGDADLPVLSRKPEELSVGFRPGKAAPLESRLRAKGSLARRCQIFQHMHQT